MSPDDPPGTGSAPDLDDTSGCPLGPRCESCGIEAGDALAVFTCASALGLWCWTLCPRCGKSTEPANIAVSTAVRLVQQHAAHLGVTLDDEQVLRSWGPLRVDHPHYRWLRA